MDLRQNRRVMAKIRNVVQFVHALKGCIVNSKNRLRLIEVAGLIKAQQKWQHGRVPVVAVDNIRLNTQSLQCIQRCSAKEAEAFSIVLVGFIGAAVQTVAGEIFRIVNKVDIESLPGQLFDVVVVYLTFGK